MSISTEPRRAGDDAAEAPGPAGASGASRAPVIDWRRWWRVPALDEMSRGAMVAIVAGLTLVSVALRLKGLHVHYWVDEGISVGIASHHFSQIPGLMRQDGSPPLYYLLLHLWMQWRGSGEAATHELSLLFAALIVPTTYLLATSVFSRREGLYAAVIAAGTTFLTLYGEETRMYTLVAWLSLIVAACFVHTFVLRHSRWRWAFGASLVVLLYTHNWGLYLAVGCAILFGLCVWRNAADRRGLWRDGIVGFGLAAIAYLPWLPTLLFQAKHTGAPWAATPRLWSLSQGAYFLVGGRGSAMIFLLAGGTGLVAIRNARMTNRTWTIAWSLLALSLGTTIVAWVVAKVSPSWAPRYLAVVVGPLILVFGLAMARAGRMGLIGLALVACFWVLDPIPTTPNAKSDVALAARWIHSDMKPGTLVLSTQPEQVPDLAYYLPPGLRYASPLGPAPDPRVVNWIDALSRFRHANDGQQIHEMIAALRPGQRIALAVPLNLPHNRDGTEWQRLMAHAGRMWAPALTYSRHLKLIRNVRPYVGSGLAVRITVFEKQ